MESLTIIEKWVLRYLFCLSQRDLLLLACFAFHSQLIIRY
jgi:hypothetical protein